ncbi:hypothetical protein EAH89_28205 [Roseomonas nepalensis]|uniref:Uncharacterized protein n=1 Tax=Muricoccus nepalensis TaxID=1854500 RepID=A0A502EXT5_9PROT|nr:hypothetical protein [Roseomonas nepalensis]TPG41932.1 hypothetical protein EAH89_28205 [Roseomonas nepalensis]
MSTARRGLLGGIAALAVSPAPGLVLSASCPDAEAIRLAEGVIEAEAACCAAHDLPTPTEEEEQARQPERDRLMGVVSERAEALAPLPVATLVGVLAKARAALAVATKDATDGEIIVHDYAEWLAYAALEDLVRVAEGEA